MEVVRILALITGGGATNFKDRMRGSMKLQMLSRHIGGVQIQQK